MAWPLLGGAGNVDDNVLELPAGTYRAISLRSFDPVTNQWSIWWLDGRTPGRLDPPVVGGFEDGVGTFIAGDTFDGRPILVRFIWSDITDDLPLGAGLLARRRHDVGGQLDHGVDPDRLIAL